MAYVRISIVKASRGNADRVEKLVRDLAGNASRQPGCQQSLVLRADDGSGELGRIAIYDSERSAANAANDAHHMALRSELHLAIEPGHIERSFETV
jgi:hypothetical protein